MARKANGARKQRRASQHIPVAKARRVKPLQRFLKAYGRGSEGVASRKAFAKRIGTTLPYLVHLAYGYRVASIEMTLKVERHTHGLVTREAMRPDVDWSAFAPRAKPESRAAAPA